MKPLRNCLALGIVVALSLGCDQALAHRSPENCGFSGFSMHLLKFTLDLKIATVITNGQEVIYGVQVQNNVVLPSPSGEIRSCDITCATFILSLPGTDGKPGTPIVLATNVNLPFGTSSIFVGLVTSKVEVASQVLLATAVAEGAGVLHDHSLPGCSPQATCVTNACDRTLVTSEKTAHVVVRNPCINLLSQCTTTNIDGAAVLTFAGSVTNCGDEILTNIFIFIDQPFAVIRVTNISQLAPGESIGFGRTYTNFPGPDRLTLIGIATGFDSGGATYATNTFQCNAACTDPAISIQAGVACLRAGATCPVQNNDYQPVVTGVKGNTSNSAADNPAFCYRLVIRNVGQDPLTNIVLTDPGLGIHSTFPGPLAPGQAITFTTQTNWGHSVTNVARVTAQCGGPNAGAAFVSAQTHTIAWVVAASLSCDQVLFSSDDLDGNPGDGHVTLPQDGAVHYVTNAVRVCNNGAVALTNISLYYLRPEGVICAQPPRIDLAVGQCTTVILCIQPVTTDALFCATNWSHQTFVSGPVRSPGNPSCGFNRYGTNIVVRASGSARIDCVSRQGCVAGPGYWLHHANAWPVETITIGGIAYEKSAALAKMSASDQGGKDKSVTLFRQLVAAKLNVLNGAESDCIQTTISSADQWFQTHAPGGVPANVPANSSAWKEGEGLKNELERYNEGRLCAKRKC